MPKADSLPEDYQDHLDRLTRHPHDTVGGWLVVALAALVILLGFSARPLPDLADPAAPSRAANPISLAEEIGMTTGPAR
jgi:hypothetical protein